MLKIISGLAAAGFFLITSPPALAESESMGPFNEKVLFRAGILYANQDTQLSLGGDALGVNVDLEDFFGLEKELTNVGQYLVQGRFKEKHRIGAQYYAMNRSATAVLSQDWTGDNIQASAGANADTKLDVDVIDLTYSYSFIRNEKHELSGSAGLFWMDFDVSIDLEGDLIVDGQPNSGGRANASGSVGFPLPLFGLAYDYAITPKWLVGAAFKWFALRTDKIDGSMVMVGANTRYYFWDHFEVGAGLTSFDLDFSYDTGDLRGNVNWSFWGPQAFIGARF